MAEIAQIKTVPLYGEAPAAAEATHGIMVAVNTDADGMPVEFVRKLADTIALQVVAVVNEPQVYEDWMGGNLNDSVLYHGLILEEAILIRTLAPASPALAARILEKIARYGGRA